MQWPSSQRQINSKLLLIPRGVAYRSHKSKRDSSIYIYMNTQRGRNRFRDEAERSNPPSLHRLCKHDTCDTTRTEAEGDPEEPARPPESSEEKKFRFRFDSREGMEDKRQLPSSSSSSSSSSSQRQTDKSGKERKGKSPHVQSTTAPRKSSSMPKTKTRGRGESTKTTGNE
jgi:hypothetical protein